MFRPLEGAIDSHLAPDSISMSLLVNISPNVEVSQTMTQREMVDVMAQGCKVPDMCAELCK